MAAGGIPLGAMSYLRTGLYVAMTKEGVQRGTNIVKKDKVQRQYKEVADELENLKSIVFSMNEDKNIKE